MDISEVILRYRNRQNNGTNQWIAISNFSFLEAPEPSTFSLLSLGLAALGTAQRWRRPTPARRRARTLRN